jgi:tetratricopeptide (TPR) repeat protein
MKIAVYTIAKNEEQFVQRWAESCEEADYRFILDTGSTDKTVRKAIDAGVEFSIAAISPWRFDDSRNTALSLLPDDIDICIALDMDEVLLPGWRQALEKISPKTTRPRYKYTWSWTAEGSPGLQYSADKIHKRHGYRWKHPVHEVLVTDRAIEVQEWIDLEIHHYPDETKSRAQYLPLLELAVSEDPSNDRNTYYLAREYFFKGLLSEAADAFKKHLELPSATWAPERAASMRYLAKCEINLADQWLAKAVKEAPGRREALVELSMHYHLKGDWSLSLKYAFEAITIVEKPLDYLCEEFAWNDLPWDLAAVSAHHLGSIDEALKYGTKALELSPYNERLARNLEFYKAN